jgi:hypothetical protein
MRKIARRNTKDFKVGELAHLTKQDKNGKGNETKATV